MTSCAAVALALTACSTDDIALTEKDDSEKTPIEFSMTDDGSSTAAVSGVTRAGFSESTGIVMRMVANNASSQYKYTKTSATANAESGSVGYSTVDFKVNETATTRYWDDAYGRDTKLSIYAVAVPGKAITTALQGLGTENESSWSTSSTTKPTTSITWEVSKSQGSTKAEGETPAKDPINEEDLVYSNNIKSDGIKGVYKWDFTNSGYKGFSDLANGQMEFTLKTAGQTTGPGKFDKGNMNFTHALSRMTINVKLDTNKGFTSNNKVEKATMVNMPCKGTLDLENGTFGTYDTSNYSDITMAELNADANSDYKNKFIGQVLPGYKIGKDVENTNVLQFKVGDNIYYITQKMVYDALSAATNSSSLVYDDDNKSNIIMSQGQNYILNITVSKTGINNITASLVDWTTIETSEFARNNAYLTFNFSNYSGTASNNFSLYRAAKTYESLITDTYTPDYTWDKGYDDAATLTSETSGNNTKWKTNWYWDDNKTFYHLRMVGNDTGDDKKARAISGKDDKQYFEIKSGTTGSNYTWGAPFKKNGENNVTLYYNTDKGFDATSASGSQSNDHNISQALGATNSNIHLTELNMLSHIKVKLTTSTDNDKVELDGATVTLTGIYTTGKVYMGNGLVEATGSRSTQAANLAAVTNETNTYEYYVVPQALKETKDGKETYVCFQITTKDNNVYTVKEKLSTITASSVGTNVVTVQTANNAITDWYPSCSYVYTFKLTKAGINVTATLVPYSEIKGNNQDVSLED